MEERIEKLFEEIKQDRMFLERQLVGWIGGREILVWGGVKGNDYWLEFAEKYNLTVAGYIDSDSTKTELNGYPIWHPDVAPAGNCYIIIGLKKQYDVVAEKMKAWGKKQVYDYFYLPDNQITVTYCSGKYLDFYGNSICGSVDGFRVSMCADSTLVVGSDCKIDKSVEIILQGGATLILGDGCYLGKECSIKVMENGQVYLGPKCKVYKRAEVQCGKAGRIYIDRECTFGPNLRIADYRSNKLLIHQDCMFSSDVIVQMTNGHALLDLESKRAYHCNGDLIEIGEHVWVGRRCSIRYGTLIKAGSMIGMESFVTGEVPENVIAAGNPLKVIKKNIAWNRQRDEEEWSSFEEYDFRKM